MYCILNVAYRAVYVHIVFGQANHKGTRVTARRVNRREGRGQHTNKRWTDRQDDTSVSAQYLLYCRRHVSWNHVLFTMPSLDKGWDRAGKTGREKEKREKKKKRQQCGGTQKNGMSSTTILCCELLFDVKR